MAVNELTNLRSADQSVGTLYSFIKSVEYLDLNHTVLIARLSEILDSNNRDLVEEVIITVGTIGPAAAAVMPRPPLSCFRHSQTSPASPQPLQTFHQIDRAAQNGRPKVAGFFAAFANRSNGELRRIQPVLHFFPPQRA